MFKFVIRLLLALSITVAVITLALPACGLIGGSDHDDGIDVETYVYGEELITNGDFSVSTNWEFYVYDSLPILAQGSGAFINGEYVMQMTQLSQSDTILGWHGALRYTGNVPLVLGSTYEISFDAKATGDVEFSAVFILNEEPFTYYGGTYPKLTSEMIKYVGHFTMEQPSDSAPMLNFGIGNHLEMVTVDNVSVREVISGYNL